MSTILMKILEFLIMAFFVFLSGCSTASFVPLSSEFKGMEKLTSTDPQKIGIFKSTIPFKEYQEIGIVIVHSGNSDINVLFKEMRNQAAKHGADAVLNYRLTSLTETHSVPVTSTSCIPSGGCNTITSATTSTSIIYTIVGTLVRRK